MAVADVVTAGGVKEVDCKSIRTIAPLQFVSPYNTYKNNIIIPIYRQVLSSSSTSAAPEGRHQQIIIMR